MNEINFFIREEEFGWLSNFERTPITIMVRWGTVTYPTNEHHYQAQKANCEEVHDWIAFAPHARLAMVIGRQLERNKYLQKYMVEDWDSKKLDVMLKGLRHKFQNPRLRKLLLETEDREIHEGNPEDSFWGGDGQDWLGRLIMQVREEIRVSTKQREEES